MARTAIWATKRPRASESGRGDPRRRRQRTATEPLARFRVARTADLDEAQDAMQSTFLPLRMRPLEPSGPSELDLRLNVAQVGGVTVCYVRMGRDLHIDT